MIFLRSLKHLLPPSEFSNLQKLYLSGIPRSLFSKSKRRNARKTRPPKMKNNEPPQTQTQTLRPLFDQILGILGTENVKSDHISPGFLYSDCTQMLQTRNGEMAEGPSDSPQAVCLNAEPKIEDKEEVDISPTIHSITEIVRDKNSLGSMEERLEKAGFEYNVEIVDKVLKRCFKHPRLALRFFEWVKSKEDFEQSTETYNTIIYIAGEARDFEKVEFLVEEMEKSSCGKDIRTWTILVGVYGKAKLISKALVIFEKMKKSGVQPDETAYRIMLLYLCKAGKGEIAFEFYKEMVFRNMVLSAGLYLQLQKCLALSGNTDAMFAVGNDMLRSSDIPERVVYGAMLKSLCIAGKIKEALELIRTLKDNNISLVPDNFKTLVKGLCRADRISDALEIVDILKKQNSIDEEIYEILVDGYLRKDDFLSAFGLLQSLKESGYRPTLATYTCLMQYLIRINKFQEAMELYKEMIGIGIHLDNIAGTALVAGCISQNRISEAWQIFSTMLEKGIRLTRKSCCIFLKELCKVSATDDVMKMLIQMKDLKVEVGDDILKLVVSYMEKKGQMDKVKAMQQMWRTCDIGPGEFSSLVSSQKVTEPEPEPFVKQKCSDHDALESTTKPYKEEDLQEVCQILSSSKDWCSMQVDLDRCTVEFARDLVFAILQNGSLHTVVVLQFFLWIGKKIGYRHDVKSYNMAIKLSGRAKDFKAMRHLFHEMHRNGCSATPDTWTIMIMQYGRTGLTDIALRTFREMKATGCKPNESTYKFLLISLCGRKGRKAEEAVQIFQEAIREGLHPDKEMIESYLSCLCEVGKLEDARKALQLLQTIDFTVSLTSSLYVRALCRTGKLEEALEFVEESGPEKHTLSQYTYGSLFHSLLRAGREEEAMEKMEAMKQAGIHPTVHVYTSLMVHFFKKRQVSRALETLEKMKEMGCQPTTVTYSAMVRGYMEMGKIAEAWDVFHHMKRNGPFPDFKTYSMFIHCLCKKGSSEEAVQLLDDMMDNGIIPSTVNFRTVMFGLNREGKPDLARNVLLKKGNLKFRRKVSP